MPEPAEILPLNEAEQAWLAEQLTRARELGLTSIDALEEFFEAQRSAWYEQREDRRPDPSPQVALIGAALGQMLIEACDLEWSVLTDEQGTALAVTGETTSIALLPMSSVAKRWTGETMTSLPEYLKLASAEVERLRRAAARELTSPDEPADRGQRTRGRRHRSRR